MPPDPMLQNQKMNTTRISTIPVPGARLYYKAHGSGPVLLIIAGGGGDADSSDRFADLMLDHFTVVTYDRRGYWRSPLDDPDQGIQIRTHSDDVHHLLAALTAGPAYVLGSSMGALVGLDLVIQHPGQVSMLVAHEPPVLQLLSESEQPQNPFQSYQQEGASAAMRKFAASIGLNRTQRNNDHELPLEKMQRSANNRESFFKVDAGAVNHYTLDIAALCAAPTRIILAGGSEGRAYFPYICAARLAERMGKTLVEFPGNHAAFVGRPREFAEKLGEMLDKG